METADLGSGPPGCRPHWALPAFRSVLPAIFPGMTGPLVAGRRGAPCGAGLLRDPRVLIPCSVLDARARELLRAPALTAGAGYHRGLGRPEQGETGPHSLRACRGDTLRSPGWVVADRSYRKLHLPAFLAAQARTATDAASLARLPLPPSGEEALLVPQQCAPGGTGSWHPLTPGCRGLHPTPAQEADRALEGLVERLAPHDCMQRGCTWARAWWAATSSSGRPETAYLSELPAPRDPCCSSSGGKHVSIKRDTKGAMFPCDKKCHAQAGAATSPSHFWNLIPNGPQTPGQAALSDPLTPRGSPDGRRRPTVESFVDVE